VLVETPGIPVLVDGAVAVDGDLGASVVDPVVAVEVTGGEAVVVKIAVRNPGVSNSNDPDGR
jgi:hypothetical protein